MTTINVRNKKQAQPQIGETPSQQLIKKADASVTIDTPNGLQVTLRKPGVLSQFRLVKMLGEAAKNQVYVGMVLPITYITGIDGKPVNYPNNEREIEALITRLDEDGVTAVMQAVDEHFGAQSKPEEIREEVKN
ncbi:hypothetical protein [Burkholderia vietnamiensis]|uniref:hypothetical protein n=1 Tax=Burkholderia vietnamiensis TaxID=60552 RepID=UPI00158C4298|nr:hypothetical protein [Burkholderia vietnamiensis]MCA8013308.1 hypothetical protein [Burkholderia vietnamiensis]MCA8266416.1 hypothetical protein [Burkholderia vietnamiensis]HDR9003054.1 hypothetical protein [Burkholderia vietnamiensis]HDR9006902.1 hypothetical protein [Burkholderia vietnamiensis]